MDGWHRRGNHDVATAPDGVAEMSITAKVWGLDLPVVAAFHVSRMALLLIAAEPMYRLGCAVLGKYRRSA